MTTVQLARPTRASAVSEDLVRRDHRKLRVFTAADQLVLEVYDQTRSFPKEERFGLQSQIRRAAVSVPTNIVEGSARRSLADYLHFLNMAMSSASEVAYLLDLSARLGFLSQPAAEQLGDRYRHLVRALYKIIDALHSGLKPDA